MSELTEELVAAFDVHILIPTGLGSGRSSLLYKLQTMLHQLQAELSTNLEYDFFDISM